MFHVKRDVRSVEGDGNQRDRKGKGEGGRDGIIVRAEGRLGM